MPSSSLLFFSHAVTSVAFLMGDVVENDALCILQASLIAFFELASILWVFMIAFSLHRGVLNV